MKRLSKVRVALSALLLLAWLVAEENCRAAQPVAVPSASAESAAADCHDAGVSANGRFIVFVSQADNLAPNDHNGAFDVFVRDRALSRTILVSVNRAGTGSGNGRSLAASLSADGRFVTFESSASDLVANDTNNVSDIFVRDLVDGTTTLVSVSNNGVSPANGASSWPVMTPDGRFILFESRASNLDTTDINGVSDLFVRDLTAGTTKLVTRDRFGAASALAGGPVFPDTARISGDGRWVAFTSGATNLVTNDNNRRSDVFVRDILNGSNLLVSANTNGVAGNRDSSSPAMSADGRFVAFQSMAGDLVLSALLVTNNNVYLRDLASGKTTLVSVNRTGTFNTKDASFGPVISADGRYVAFQSMANDLVTDQVISPTPTLGVFVRDMQMGKTIMVSMQSHMTVSDSDYYTYWIKGNSEWRALPLSISRDGRFVIFQSQGNDETTTLPKGGVIGSNVFTYLLGTHIFDQTTGTSTRISSATFPVLSEDGRVVAFQSAAQDQVASDSSAVVNIFARDLGGGSTELISRRDSTLDSLTGNAMSQLTPTSISANGRFVAYESFASNLTPGDTNGTSDVFVRDLITGSNELIRVNADLTGSRRPSRLPAISGDARWIAYETVADNNPLANGLNNQFNLIAYDRLGRTNLFIASVSPTNKPGATATPAWSADGRYLAFQSSWPDLAIPSNAAGQIYYRDLSQGTNVLVSLNQLGSAGGNRWSWNPLISADGMRVLFLSAATDLVTNIVSGTNLFLWDAASRRISLISVSTNGGALNRISKPVLTADGRFALFLNRADLYFYDLTASTLGLIATNASDASLNADGRFIAFESISDIFVHDRASNTIALISVNVGGTAGGNGKSTSPLITPDGRYVIFTSQASDLVAGDANEFADVFLRDTAAGTTMRLSVDFHGSGSGNRLSANPVLSSSGSVVLFESYSSDLSVGDFNQAKDIFAVRLGAGDSDGDGVADDWEVAYFGDLSHDGAGDFDGDGFSDLAEFRTGTNPADNDSVFRAFTLASPNLGNRVMVIWNSVPGRTYRVQYKDDIVDPAWADLPGDVLALGGSGAKLDDTAQRAETRFYRVIALP